jgi:hypothetical protein
MGDLHAFDLILFVAATFAAAFVAGLAFGIDAAASSCGDDRATLGLLQLTA